MHPLMMDLLPLVRQGYCCSQLLVQLLVQAQGREVPDLVRALHGLCRHRPVRRALRPAHGRCLCAGPAGGQRRGRRGAPSHAGPPAQ